MLQRLARATTRRRGRSRTSLERLELDFVDLYLIHWPVPAHDRYVETWRAFIDLRSARASCARSASPTSSPSTSRRIVDETGVTPSVNQIELHPRFQQRGLRREHADRGIVTEAWSPLAQGEVLDDPTLTEIAEAHGKTTGQVVAALAPAARQRRLPEVGRPRSGSRRTSTLFDFHLTDDEMDAIDGARRRRAHRARPGHVRGAVAQPR